MVRTKVARPRLVFVVLMAVLTPCFALGAQRRPETPASDMANVRAELAAVLLQSKKYDDAAREYRSLVARDTKSFEYRLGLARALAWGGKPQEAERELRVLKARNLQIATIDSLLRSVRAAMKPNAIEAATWVAERPSYAPYRLAFARALAAERNGRLAGAHYDTLLLGSSLGQLPDPVVLRREQAQAYFTAGATTAGITSLRDVLRYTPRDTAARHQLAVALADERWRDHARAHYDTLLAETPTAALYVERARLRFEMGDRAGAEADLQASLPLGSTVAGYVMLGDVYRERGSRMSALAMYRGALLLSEDGDDELRMPIYAAIARIEREERPVALAPTIGDDPGWRINTDGVSDNLGFHYTSSTLRRTIPIGSAVSVGIGVMHQYLGERSPDRRISLNAVGAEAGVAGEGGYGPFFARAGIRGGTLRVPSSRALTIGGLNAAAWLNAWQLAVGASMGPAYPSLLTTTAVRPLNDEDDDVLTEKNIDAAFGGPLLRADFAATAQQTWLSDGNRRTTLQGYLRYPLASGLSVVYNTSAIKFAKRSALYWDPLTYVAHGVGLEVAQRETHGLSMAARAIPGVARSRVVPLPTIRPPGGRPRVREPVNQSAFQIGASGEMIWREPDWEGTAAINFGQSRTGVYRRFGLTLGVRVLQ